MSHAAKWLTDALMFLDRAELKGSEVNDFITARSILMAIEDGRLKLLPVEKHEVEPVPYTEPTE